MEWRRGGAKGIPEGYCIEVVADHFYDKQDPDPYFGEKSAGWQVADPHLK
jgi:hypothetical protein